MDWLLNDTDWTGWQILLFAFGVGFVSAMTGDIITLRRKGGRDGGTTEG